MSRAMSRQPARFAVLLAHVLAGFALCGGAAATEFRSTADAPSVLYDAPSAKARPQFVFGRDVPVEVIVSVEGWTKVRDSAGTIGWFATKGLSDKRTLQVRVPVADVRAMAEDTAPIVFRAEQNVLLDLAEVAATPAGATVPGWVKVRHRDGQVGFVRVTQVFGF
jgi:SH3-like domain-containing protein